MERNAYREMGDFHYGEKEAQRLNPRTPWWTRVLLQMYHCTAGYGERIMPPLMWSVGLFFVSFGVYLCSDFLHNWYSTFLYTIKVGLFLKPNAPPYTHWIARSVYLLQSVLSPVFLGLLALAVRQRLKWSAPLNWDRKK